jgi:iron complex outermembrane recepter protein
MNKLPRFVRALLTLAVASGALLSAQSVRSDAKQSFNIPSGDARPMLREFAAQAKREILFDVENVSGVTTNAVQGELTALQALDQMLANTGLIAGQDAKTGALAIRRQTPEERKNVERAIARTSDRPEIPVNEKPNELPVFEVIAGKVLNMDIRRTRDDPQPYTIFERETIAQSGAVNLEDFFRKRLTMLQGEARTSDQIAASTVIAGSALDLRGLGTQRTLILVDGRRLPRFYGGTAVQGQANLNGLPLSAIERIDVLPASASSIYGGDAMGGIINIVMRRDYAGFEMKLTYDNSFESDTARRTVELSGGFNLEKGKTNVLFAVSSSERNALTVEDRDFDQEGLRRNLALNPNLFGPGVIAPLGATVNIRSLSGNLQLKPQYGGANLNSAITSLPIGYAGVASDNGAGLVANAGRYNLDLAASAQASPNRGARWALLRGGQTESALLTLRRQFSPRLQVYAEAFGASERTKILASSLFLSSNLVLQPSAPTNPFQQAIQITVPNSSADANRWTLRREQRLAAGVIYEFTHDWKLLADYTRNFTKLSALTGASLPADGRTAIVSGALDVLRDPVAFPVDLSSFLPAPDVFGPYETIQQLGTVRLAGSALSLPAGKPTFSFLGEYREDHRPAALAFGNPSPEKSQDVWSGYAEAQVPLISPEMNIPLARSAMLQTSVRFDDYATKATNNEIRPNTIPSPPVTSRVSAWSSLAALKFELTKDLAMRVSYGSAFLPPTIQQLVTDTFTTPLSVRDPKRGNTIYPIPPGNYLTGGNADLGPEKSKTLSVGMVLTPRILPGFRLSLDYVDTKIRDAIGVFDVINNEALFPERVQRGPNLPGDPAGWAGPVTRFDQTIANISHLQVQSYDLQASYRRKAPWGGELDAYAAATWQPHRREQLLAGAPVSESMGFNNFPKLKGSGGITWQGAKYSFGWSMTYVDKFLAYSSTAPAAAVANVILNQGDNGQVSAQSYHEVFGTYRFGRQTARGLQKLLNGIELQVGVRNIFNKRPPYQIIGNPSSPASYVSGYGDPRLATYYVTLKKRL